MMSALRDAVLSLFGIGAVPELERQPTHDDDVHRIRNQATVTYGTFDREMRKARKWAHGERMSGDLERQIAETQAATEAVRKFVATHSHDPDDGLLSGMDRPLKRGDGR